MNLGIGVGITNRIGGNSPGDVTGPAVLNVTSAKANGTYNVGEVIDITVQFSETVIVTGTPQLQLETGTVDRTINYQSGSGTDTLTFRYTVQSGDSSGDLDYKANNSLTLNGGAIQDGAGNNATLILPDPGASGSLGANKAIVIDTIGPEVTGFAATSPNIGGTIAITTFTATDDAGVTGYLITTSSTPPGAGDAGWTGSAPTTFDATSEGSCTLYPWAKDAAGNVSTVYGSPVAVDVYQTPAYANYGGMGDRRAQITISNTLSINGVVSRLIDGAYANDNYFVTQAVAGLYIRFDFGVGAPRVITECTYRQQNTTAQGTWKWQASNNATDWVDIGTSFAMGGVATQIQTALSANTTPYRYYQLLGVSGSTSSNPYVYEFEFKIGNKINP